MRYVTGTDEQGRTIDVRDPLSAKLKAIADSAGPVADRLAPALLEVESIFGARGADPRMRSVVTEALTKLFELGARQAVRTFQSR
jgi:fructuronate reductase